MKPGIFSIFFEKYSNTTFVKILSVGAALIHEERRKDRGADVQTGRYVYRQDEANIRFRNFAEVPSAEFEHAISEIQWLQI